MQQSMRAAARSHRGRALTALSVVLLTATAFVGGSASPASATSCYSPYVGTWGTPDPAQSAYITDIVVQFTGNVCETSVAVWGSCQTERVDYWSACYWGAKRIASNGTAVFNLNGYQRTVALNGAANGVLNYSARWSNGFATTSQLVKF